MTLDTVTVHVDEPPSAGGISTTRPKHCLVAVACEVMAMAMPLDVAVPLGVAVPVPVSAAVTVGVDVRVCLSGDSRVSNGMSIR